MLPSHWKIQIDEETEVCEDGKGGIDDVGWDVVVLS
jgi:hypothetical protein